MLAKVISGAVMGRVLTPLTNARLHTGGLGELSRKNAKNTKGEL
jgi:hypothetical protein